MCVNPCNFAHTHTKTPLTPNCRTMPVVFKGSVQPVGARVQKGPVARCYSRRALREYGTGVFNQGPKLCESLFY